MKTNTKGIQASKSEGMTYNFEAVNNIIIHRPKIVELPYESTAFDFLKSWFIGEEIGEPRRTKCRIWLLRVQRVRST